CLSGGFRAALFHLGALRRLNELGVLSHVDTISSVGGSILSAHLAARICSSPEAGTQIPDWQSPGAEPFFAFAGTNIGTGPVLASKAATAASAHPQWL